LLYIAEGCRQSSQVHQTLMHCRFAWLLRFSSGAAGRCRLMPTIRIVDTSAALEISYSFRAASCLIQLTHCTVIAVAMLLPSAWGTRNAYKHGTTVAAASAPYEKFRVHLQMALAPGHESQFVMCTLPWLLSCSTARQNNKYPPTHLRRTPFHPT
jgi:hypothetical protein